MKGSSISKERIILGLGANLGAPRAQLAAAVRRLEGLAGPLRCSSLYRTEPVGYLDQPAFLNLVCVGETGQQPEQLLAALQRVEDDLGRVRLLPNGPRTLDIDLLAYQERVTDTEKLVLPHPRLHERAFVLVPLVEVLPEWRHPRLGRTAGELLLDLGEHPSVERLGALVLDDASATGMNAVEAVKAQAVQAPLGTDSPC